MLVFMRVSGSGESTKRPSHCVKFDPIPLATSLNRVHRNDKQCHYLDGCCSTMVVLVIWMSLRFGCRDPQLMVDCIRCAMRNKRVSTMAHHPNEFAPLISKWTTVLQDFLLRLRAWQDGLANTEMDLEGFKRWVKLYHTPGSKSCGYMMYDDAGTYRGPGLYIRKLDYRRSAFDIGNVSVFVVYLTNRTRVPHPLAPMCNPAEDCVRSCVITVCRGARYTRRTLQKAIQTLRETQTSH